MMLSVCTSFLMEKLKPGCEAEPEVLADDVMVLVEKEVPEEISKSRSLARALSLHKLSFLHTQTNDEQGGLMKVENEALEVPRRWV